MASEDDIIKITIYYPDTTDDVFQHISPLVHKTTFKFKRSQRLTFFHLWRKIGNRLVYYADTSAAITDLDLPLDDLVDRRLTFRAYPTSESVAVEELMFKCDERHLQIMDSHLCALNERLQQRKRQRDAISRIVPEPIQETIRPVVPRTAVSALKEPPRQFYCSECSKQYSNLSNFKRHLVSDKHLKRCRQNKIKN